MFKKYTKNFLDKEITPQNPIEQEMLAAMSSLPSTLNTPPLTNVQNDDNFDEPETTIGENVTLRGTLTFQKLLRIDGSFDGELISQGKIIIGPKGQVKCNIDLEEAFISGKVEGNIRVKGRLVLRGRAEVRGDITASSLSVDEGVSINGHVKVCQVEDTSHLSSESSSW